MRKISDTELHKLLDRVRLADAAVAAAKRAYDDACITKMAADHERRHAHEAAAKHLTHEQGPVLYDDAVWAAQGLRVTHTRIGRDLSPRQESLLPNAAVA